MANENGRKVWTFDKCPACGSRNRIAENVARREQKAGRLGTDFHPVLHQETTVIADPRRVIIGPTSVPAIVAHYDCCLDCGCYYCVRLELGSAVIQPRPPAALGGRG